MCNYMLTVIITSTTRMLDAGEWQILAGFKKRMPLGPRDRDKVIALRDLLNSGSVAGGMVNALSNAASWQWEFPAEHSTLLLDIMNKAGVDWPDPMPDIECPSITINLSTC